MRRRVASVAITFLLVLTLALGAFGGGFHFRSITFRTGSLVFEGVGVGLGNTEFTATLDATATVRANCVNKGGTAAAGRNDLTASVTGEDTVIRTDDRGQTAVTLTVDATLPDLDERPNRKADCPNGNWKIANVIVVEWTSAHLLITELVTGATVFEADYVCSGGGVVFDENGSPVTNNGEYVLNPVSCTEA